MRYLNLRSRNTNRISVSSHHRLLKPFEILILSILIIHPCYPLPSKGFKNSILGKKRLNNHHLYHQTNFVSNNSNFHQGNSSHIALVDCHVPLKRTPARPAKARIQFILRGRSSRNKSAAVFLKNIGSFSLEKSFIVRCKGLNIIFSL